MSSQLVNVKKWQWFVDRETNQTSAGVPDSTTPNQIENIEPHNAAVTASVERLQQQIWEGGWTPAVGGNLLVACESNSVSSDNSTPQESDYRFYGSWSQRVRMRRQWISRRLPKSFRVG